MIRRLSRGRRKSRGQLGEPQETVQQDRVFRESMGVWAGDWSPRGGGRPRPRGRRTA